MKIYVITKGSYSSYHICAVATDKKKAKKLAKIYTDRYDDAKVEEYDTEDCEDLLSGKVPYEVIFDVAGEVLDARKVIDVWDFNPVVSLTRVYEHGINFHCPGRYSAALSVGLYASSEEEAIKIAAEKRAKYLAEKNGLC